MNRFITLILMLTTLLSFTQKVTASAPLSENETASMANCLMSMNTNEAHMDMTEEQCARNGMNHNMDCQSGCDFMTVVSAFYFVEQKLLPIQSSSLLTYQIGSASAPYYFPESLYRPPLIS